MCVRVCVCVRERVRERTFRQYEQLNTSLTCATYSPSIQAEYLPLNQQDWEDQMAYNLRMRIREGARFLQYIGQREPVSESDKAIDEDMLSASYRVLYYVCARAHLLLLHRIASQMGKRTGKALVNLLSPDVCLCIALRYIYQGHFPQSTDQNVLYRYPNCCCVSSSRLNPSLSTIQGPRATLTEPELKSARIRPADGPVAPFKRQLVVN